MTQEQNRISSFDCDHQPKGSQPEQTKAQFYCTSKFHDEVIICEREECAGSPICPICGAVMTYGMYGVRNVVYKDYTHYYTILGQVMKKDLI